MAELMTQAAYARSRKVTKQAIGDLVKRKIIKLVDGMIDPEYADLQLVRSLNPAKAKTLNAAANGAEPADDAVDGKVVSMSAYQEQRLARERIETMNAQLDYDERVGNLIDRAGVLRALKEAGRSLADQMMGLPRRLAPELAGCGDPIRAEKQLEAEFRLVLNQFAQTLIAQLEAKQSPRG